MAQNNQLSSEPDEEGVIEYFYSAHSAYAYLGAWELDRIAAQTGWRVQHRPFDFGPVIAAAGGKRFGERSQAHLDYFFGREMVRWAAWRGLPMIRHRPTYHDNPLALANGMIIAAGPDADRLSRAILQAHWRDDADIADCAAMHALARSLDLDADELIATAQSDEVQRRHQLNTAEAIARNVFGSPTYFVRGDMFYGQDRLEMVEAAIAAPFAP
jgi:2-hydroxychromene-2-carboxylate isomerase